MAVDRQKSGLECPECLVAAADGQTGPLEVAMPSAMIAAMSPATSMIGIVAEDLRTPAGI